MSVSTMEKKTSKINVPRLILHEASAADYCQSILESGNSEVFWFLTGLAPYRGFSRPFRDHEGSWWWRPKPQFAWPVNYAKPHNQRPILPLGRAVLGHQYPVEASQANSLLHFNVISDLEGYSLSRIAPQKRRAVRKGLRELVISPIDLKNPDEVMEAQIVWNSHVQRTGWNRAFSTRTFADKFAPLSDTAGTTVISAREKASGRLCAWVIARSIEGAIYIDTIASHTDRLAKRPNDTLIFSLLYCAKQSPNIQQANYFLRSSLKPLEDFKRSLGFDSSGIPAYLHIQPAVAFAIRRLATSVWQRLHGDTII